MKRTVYISCMIFVVLSFCGCTHNNGDIGPWFGQWKVERIDKNGMPDTDYEGDCLLRFQSSVVTVVLVTNNGYAESSSLKYGNWEETGGYMHFDFKEGLNTPLNKLHMDKFVCPVCGYVGQSLIGVWECPECGTSAGEFKVECDLKVLIREGKEKQLQLVMDDGTVYTYYLVKW